MRRFSAATTLRAFKSAQLPTGTWRPPLTAQDRSALKTIYNTRVKPSPITLESPPGEIPSLLSQIKHQSENHIDTTSSLSNGLYATAIINHKPYKFTLNDLVITKHLHHAPTGSTLRLTKINEFGSKDYYIRGNSISTAYVHVEAIVLSQTWSGKYTVFRRRLGRGPGDRKWRKRSYKDLLTILRITKLDFPGFQMK